LPARSPEIFLLTWYSARSFPLAPYSFVATLNCVTFLPLARLRISGSRVRRPVNRTLFTVRTPSRSADGYRADPASGGCSDGEDAARAEKAGPGGRTTGDDGSAYQRSAVGGRRGRRWLGGQAQRSRDLCTATYRPINRQSTGRIGCLRWGDGRRAGRRAAGYLPAGRSPDAGAIALTGTPGAPPVIRTSRPALIRLATTPTGTDEPDRPLASPPPPGQPALAFGLSVGHHSRRYSRRQEVILLPSAAAGPLSTDAQARG